MTVYATPSIFADHSLRTGRGFRTVRQVELAFRELLAARPFHTISVVDVADRCGVARSTVYRKWAGVEALLWTVLRPCLQEAIRRAFNGDLKEAVEAFERLWELPGAVPAISHHSVTQLVRTNIAVIIAAEIERRCQARESETCALMIASSMVAFLMAYPDAEQLDRAKIEELVFVLYVSAFMTPRALEAAARQRARTAGRGRFPPAVSVRESLASDDYILSMIDGRPYRSLSRHLTRFGFTPEEYRRCFDLRPDYPMVARSYSLRRSELARSQFGAKRIGHSAAAAAPAA